MKFDKKLINQLAAGEIILRNEPKNTETVKEILKQAFPSCRKPASGCAYFYYRDTTGLKKWVSRGEKCSSLPDLPKIPIADFLLPEPKFKKGDRVKVIKTGKEFTVLGENKRFRTETNYYDLANGKGDCGNAPENILELALEPEQFVVGNQYEFYNGVAWYKGEFIAAVDGKTKRYFLGILGNNTEEGMFQDIRAIQPKEVTIERWVNMSQSGNQVGRKCYESKMEACQHAPQSQNVFQVKLTGTYTI